MSFLFTSNSNFYLPNVLFQVPKDKLVGLLPEPTDQTVVKNLQTLFMQNPICKN